MNEGEPPTVSATDDSFDVEISDLRHSAVSRHPPRAAALPIVFRRRLLPRQRLARGLTAAGAILVALAVALGSYSSVRDGLVGLLVGPTPVPTEVLSPDANQFYILAGAPWAAVFLDGHPLTHPPVIGADPPLHLTRGHHSMVWRADPFHPIHCVISVPVQGSDTCPYDRIFLRQPGPLAWVITFFPSLTMLPDDQRAALVRAAQSTLDGLISSETVQPGEIYARFSTTFVGSQTALATQPMRATLRLRLATDASTVQSCQFGVTELCTFLGQDCLSFCTVPEQGAPAYWSILSAVLPLWDFATRDGQLVARDQADGLALAGTGVYLRVNWEQGAWQVTPHFSDLSLAYQSVTNPESPPGFEPACAFLQTSIRAQTLQPAADPQYTQLSWRFATGPQRASGCAAVATPQPNNVMPAIPLPPAYLLQRFGVLLAANPLAHSLWPELPVADAYEQHLAWQLVGQLAPAPNGA